MNGNYNPEELQIACNIVQNINERNLIMRNMSSLNRIIQIYFQQQNRDQNEEKQVINFLFRCLDLRGSDSSILFTHLSKSKQRQNVIKRLHENYRGKFDFNLVNSSLFEYSYETIKFKDYFFYLVYLTIILVTILLWFLFRITQLNSELTKLKENDQTKKEFENELNSIKQRLETELKEKQKIENELKLKSNLTNELSSIKQNFEDEMQCKKELENQTIEKLTLKIELETLKNQLENETKIREKIEYELTTAKNQREIELLEIKELLENDLENAKRQFQTLNMSMQELEEELKSKENHEIELTTAKNNLENELVFVKSQLLNETTAKEKIEDELKAKRNLVNELESVMKQFENNQKNGNETEINKSHENEQQSFKNNQNDISQIIQIFSSFDMTIYLFLLFITHDYKKVSFDYFVSIALVGFGMNALSIFDNLLVHMIITTLFQGLHYIYFELVEEDLFSRIDSNAIKLGVLYSICASNIKHIIICTNEINKICALPVAIVLMIETIIFVFIQKSIDKKIYIINAILYFIVINRECASYSIVLILFAMVLYITISTIYSNENNKYSMILVLCASILKVILFFSYNDSIFYAGLGLFGIEIIVLFVKSFLSQNKEMLLLTLFLEIAIFIFDLNINVALFDIATFLMILSAILAYQFIAHHTFYDELKFNLIFSLAGLIQYIIISISTLSTLN